MLIERGAQRCTNLLIAERSSTETDECESLWQQVADPEVEERWDNLAVRKVTRRTKENHHMRIRDALNAQPCAQRILCSLLRCRLSCLAAEPQITNRCVPLSGRLWAHSDFTEWPPN
jgi:hypothetical protein